MFPTYSHTAEDIALTLEAVEVAFALMQAACDAGDIELRLEGRAPGEVFRKHD